MHHLRINQRLAAPAGQRGQAAVLVLVIFLTASAALTAVGTTPHTDSAGRTQMITGQIDATLQELKFWYERTGFASLGTGTPVESALGGVLSSRYPALRMAISTPIVRAGCTGVMDCEPSRQILVWYPATNPQTTANVVNGLPMHEIGGDALWQLYDARALTQQRMATGYQQMLAAGRAITAWASAQRQAAVMSTEVNFLRSSSCSTSGPALPCVDAWSAMTSIPQAMAASGLSVLDVTAPWGAVVEISNASGVASHVLPYSLAMRLRTPSGAYLTYSTGQ